LTPVGRLLTPVVTSPLVLELFKHIDRVLRIFTSPLTPLSGCYYVYFKSCWTSEKIVFSAEIRPPESRKDLSQIPTCVIMADLVSQKFQKISKSRILEFR